MLNEVTAEMLKLSQDLTFVRNLFLTFIVAIAGLSFLSDLQSQNTKVSEQAIITNISHSTTKFLVEHK